MESLSYLPKRSQLISYVLVMALLLGTSTVIMLNLEQIMHPYLRLAVMIVGFLGCVAFGYGFFYNVMRVLQPQPLLEANAEGLWFHVSFFNHGKVLWEDFLGFEVVKYGFARRVLIKLKDPEAFTNKYGGVRRFLFRRTLRRYKTPVSMPLSLIAGDPVETLKRINVYRAPLNTRDTALP
jgi:hypothetical protein